MNSKSCSIAALVMGLLVHAAPVYSDDDSGYYAGVSINRLSADFKDVNDVSFAESDNAAGLRAGYMFNDNLGIEIGYVDLGNYVAEGDAPGNRIDLDAEAFGVAVVINYTAAESIDLYGRIGANQLDIRSDSMVAGTTVTSDDESTEAYGAVGVEWDLGRLNFFAEFSKTETDINNLTLDMVSLGLKYEMGQ